VAVAGFPLKNGSTRIWVPLISSPIVACPYHVNFVLTFPFLFGDEITALNIFSARLYPFAL
jgi:hypothetical protein